jgi:cyclophilin family peptidyl-prolyl cis-trans isomerase
MAVQQTNIKKYFYMQKFICACLMLTAITGRFKAQTHSRETIIIETAFGAMKIKLFEETPLHKANFLKLVNEGYFDSLMFHRVINNFMIQGGDHLSKLAKPGDSLGHGDIGYMIPAEFKREIIHKKGRLCAARESDDINPQMASSATQFYIVMGKKRTMEDLKKYEERINKTLRTSCERAYMKTKRGVYLKEKCRQLRSGNRLDSAEIVNAMMNKEIDNECAKTPEYKFNQYQIDTYTTVGGTPHLDGTYTVFGEVIEGLEIIDKIAGVKTDNRDRPLEDIRMKVRVLN